MRIIAGAFKGRRLAPVKGLTRPTAAKVREAVFSILGPAVPGRGCWTCLPVPALWGSRP